jgi:hypothetical protein
MEIQQIVNSLGPRLCHGSHVLFGFSLVQKTERTTANDQELKNVVGQDITCKLAT